MIKTAFATSQGEMAGIIGALIEKPFLNQLIIGDIHAPMSKLSDIYSITKGSEIIGGWSVFNGFEMQTLVVPPALPESWESIRNILPLLDLNEFNAPFPKYVKEGEISTKPWESWPEFEVEHLFTDHAMQLTIEELEVMDISHLPAIRAATNEDIEELNQYFEEETKESDFQGFWNPVQLETDLFVVAEDGGKIIGVGGAHFETPLTVQIGNVNVKKEYRGKGIGKALSIACTLGIMHSKRLPTLFVNENNNVAIKMYESIGFEKYNEFEFYRLKRK